MCLPTHCMYCTAALSGCIKKKSCIINLIAVQSHTSVSIFHDVSKYPWLECYCFDHIESQKCMS